MAFSFYLGFHLVSSGIFMFAFSRLSGLGVVGAVAAGLAYALTQNLGATVCCTVQMQYGPWIPLGLIGTELALRCHRWPEIVLALSLSSFAVAQLAAGWIGQGLILGSLVIAGYLVWRMMVVGSAQHDWSPVVRSWRTVAYGCWIFGIGIALAAAGLLIRLDAVDRAYVGSSAYQAIPADLFGWEPAVLFDALLVYRDYWFSYYLGGAAIIGCALGLILSFRHRLFLYFGLVALLGAILPLSPTHIHELLFLIPRFESLYAHDPGRMLSVMPIGTAALIGLAIDKRRHLVSGRAGWVTLFVIVAVTVSLLRLDQANPAWSIGAVTVAAALLFVVGLVILASGAYCSDAWRARLNVVSVTFLLTSVLVDPAARTVLSKLEGADREVWEDAVSTTLNERDDAGTAAILAELRTRYPEQWRFAGFLAPPTTWWHSHEHYYEPWVLAAVANNRAMIVDQYDLQGYNPAQIVQYQQTMAAMNGFEREYHAALLYGAGFGSPILDMLNTRFVIVPHPLEVRTTNDGLMIEDDPAPGFRIIAVTDAATIIENLEWLPRAWLVNDIVKMPAHEALFAIGNGTVDPRQTATVEELPGLTLDPAPEQTGSSVVVRYDPDVVEINVNSVGQAFLILGDVYDPGWTVTIDGEPAKLHRANGVLRGVFVPDGEHRVRFEYQPSELQIGLAISGASFVLVAALGVWVAIRRRQFTSAA